MDGPAHRRCCATPDGEPRPRRPRRRLARRVAHRVHGDRGSQLRGVRDGRRRRTIAPPHLPRGEHCRPRLDAGREDPFHQRRGPRERRRFPRLRARPGRRRSRPAPGRSGHRAGLRARGNRHRARPPHDRSGPLEAIPRRETRRHLDRSQGRRHLPPADLPRREPRVAHVGGTTHLLPVGSRRRRQPVLVHAHRRGRTPPQRSRVLLRALGADRRDAHRVPARRRALDLRSAPGRVGADRRRPP